METRGYCVALLFNVDALTDEEVGQGKVAQMLHGRPMALSILTILLIYMIR